jgi:hypothetical protein
VAISGHQWKCLGRKSSACQRFGFRSGFVSVMGRVSFGFRLVSGGFGFRLVSGGVRERCFGVRVEVDVPTRRLRPAAPTTSCAMSRCGMCGAT